MDVTITDTGNRDSSPELPLKSSSESEFLVHDEWINDDISFPTKSDALIASLALKKQSDPVLIDAFLSLLKNPNFNTTECTLHSVADIHSFASSYRKEKDNHTPRQSFPMQIPIFVWEEVMVHIGDQWVAYALKLCDDAAQYKTSWDNNIFAAPYSHQLSDLYNASLVHPSWTRPAQRQMGRVLVLHKTNEDTLNAAIKSGLYGNWTQILAMKGSVFDGWGTPPQGSTDNLSPNVSLLKSFIARLPSLNTLHFESSVLGHPLVLLNSLEFLSSVDTVSIINQNISINKSTDEIFGQVDRWPGLRNLSLTGFECNLKSPDPLDRLLASRNLPELSSVFISGGGAHLHKETLIHWIRWKKTSLQHESMKFTACDIRFRRNCVSPSLHLPNVNNDFEHVDYFSILDHEPSLSWLPNIDQISLANIYDSEAEQILEMAAVVHHLSWSGTSFSPTVSLPPNLSDLVLSVPIATDDNWHTYDRNLHAFLLNKGVEGLRRITITISPFGHPHELHTEMDIPRIYFPRTSDLCKTLDISLTVDVI
ncbi:hypothetical protein SCHPADRAFT_931652 [Schizopora paradoxa]|uniref:Uncharacterized protein n=1 Tax=Schizopora paradoxa TaxID=27342 RepID=A0A0H2RBB2_9AGAM|nr:hypothetical protein SCHPADRAFT_931652 [Schizopora paradoxa]